MTPSAIGKNAYFGAVLALSLMLIVAVPAGSARADSDTEPVSATAIPSSPVAFVQVEGSASSIGCAQPSDNCLAVVTSESGQFAPRTVEDAVASLTAEPSSPESEAGSAELDETRPPLRHGTTGTRPTISSTTPSTLRQVKSSLSGQLM